MMTNRMKELFQKDKYELVDRIVTLEKQIEILEPVVTSRLQDCLYQFVEYYTIDDLEIVDMKLIVDRFIEDSFPDEQEEEE
tara:strand:+ start:135 stop:377 length:243 start_codon:yes stop_codon:yes gene_type:complete